MTQKWNGVIVKKNNNTAYVKVVTTKLHKYGRYIKVATVFPVDDRTNAKVGDEVGIQSCKKISKTKSKQVVEIVNKEGQNGSQVL